MGWDGMVRGGIGWMEGNRMDGWADVQMNGPD